MSHYYFLTATSPLQEVDLRTYSEVTVRDILQMSPIPEPPYMIESWTDVAEDDVFLLAERDEQLTSLVVQACEKPLAEVKKYIRNPYIYTIDGDFQAEMLQQLQQYVQEQQADVELWSIWLGADEREPLMLSATDVSFQQLEQFVGQR